MSHQPKNPGPDHPITIEAADTHVTITVGDNLVADTPNALVLREATYPPVYYVPLADVNRALLRPSQKQTFCPYKGDALYYSLSGPDVDLPDAVWTYPTPYPAVAELAGHVAFYTDRVQLTHRSKE